MPVKVIVCGAAKKGDVEHKEKMTVASALEALGVNLEKMQEEDEDIESFTITVNGKKAKLETEVDDDDRVVAVPNISNGC